MSQREMPLLLAGDSSIIICIFPNLRNVYILEGGEGEGMQTFHISFLMRFLMAPSHPHPRRNHWHLAISLSVKN